ncbi:SbcC/MukB-like Walker B domain-containing protein [Psychrobacillus sp. FJAT-51614]|uniref:SbcC/MukB-like Walker B domain-containing protein n=1 Tax=Psychrobacillus mangrovi TaxID=3117745 RepID=A0ABU8F7E4_9BACI
MLFRWKLSKALLLNFWYFTKQELKFTDGHMTIRGANGSGKSITTQSIITVLLDGNSNPERLNPYGSRQRTFKDTVLGEVDLLPDIIDRIGYITLELRKGNEIKTIGMGIKASRIKTNIDTLYFIINGEVGDSDGQFSLTEKKMEDGKMADSPLQLLTLRERIEKAAIGDIYLNRTDYAEAVNKEFFGFPTMEQYDGLIKLLLQIRGPKLFDQIKPEALAEVLTNSLPELSPEELSDAADTIARIVVIEKNLAKAKAELSSKVSSFVAIEKLEENIKLLEEQLDEKDKELYERILLNKLSESINRKIYNARKWEKNMNKLMEHENNIKFRIEWVEKKIEREEEKDTIDLIATINRNPPYENTEKLVNHLRSKINQAKKLYNGGKDKDGKENGKGFQQVIEEVFDYRQWFEFKIYYVKKGETEKLLNRKNYGTLCSGQRVLSILMPVLTALHIKYTETDRDDSLRLFTLDEAFAHVDEEDMEVLFRYFEKLDFDYMLNSQSLWGCFESVSSLDIYELSRPGNRNHVMVIPYYWNGKQRIRKDKVSADYE